MPWQLLTRPPHLSPPEHVHGHPSPRSGPRTRRGSSGPAVDTLSTALYIRAVTSPEHDLSRLRIERDAPTGSRRALVRALAIAGIVILLLAAAVVYVRSRSEVAVETIIATPVSSGSAAGGTRRRAS